MILSVGELNGNKNHSTVIKAIAKLKDPSVHYVIAGQGRLKKTLEDLARELGIARQVHLLGFRSDIANLMRVVDIYCLPSLREGMNVSLMEAMASGLPCLAGDIRGNRDLFGEDEKENLLPPKKVERWSEGIQKYMECHDRYEIPKRNRKKMERFSEREVMSRMKEIYKMVKERH